MSDRRCEVLCAGILVADLFLPPLPRLPAPGELLPTEGMLLDTGGCAANTGADLSRLGVATAVAGKIGIDMFGDFILRDLSAKKISDMSGIVRTSAFPTSQTVVLPVRGEDRRFIHSIGANADFGVEDVDLMTARSVRVLYVGGYFILPRFDAAALGELFASARRSGVRTVLDVAGVGAPGGLDRLRDVLPHTDAFLPNEDEARLLTGESDPVRQARALLDCGAGTAVVTRGERGVVACTRDRTLRAGAFSVEAVDGSGSGDAFDAGFIVGLLEGWELERTIAFASAIGASCCTRLGCTPGVFTRSEADAFLAANAIDVVKAEPPRR